MTAGSPQQGTPRDLRTVFIRNVGYSTTEKELEEVFSDIGPIRRCFLVKNKDAAQHKGFGFVQFALTEDAERAVDQLGGNTIGGRALKLELAIKRVPLKQRKRKAGRDAGEEGDDGDDAAASLQQAIPGKAPKSADKQANKAEGAGSNSRAKRAKPTATVTPQKQQLRLAPSALEASQQAVNGTPHKWVRTVALGAHTAKLLAAAAEQAEKLGKVEETIRPAPPNFIKRYKLKEDGCPDHVALFTYASVRDALQAVTQLHNQCATRSAAQSPSSNQKKNKKNKRKHPEDEHETEETAAGLGPLPQESDRMWARQLSGEGQHVKKWRVILRNLPFKANETSVRAALSEAGFVWELMMPRKPDGGLRGFAFASFTMRAHAERAIQLVNAKAISGRTVAVDWAVPKAQYESGASTSGAPQRHEAAEGEEKEAPGQGKHSNVDEEDDSAGEEDDSEGEEENFDSELQDEDEHEEGGELEARYKKLRGSSKEAASRALGGRERGLGLSDDDQGLDDDDDDDDDDIYDAELDFDGLDNSNMEDGGSDDDDDADANDAGKEEGLNVDARAAGGKTVKTSGKGKHEKESPGCMLDDEEEARAHEHNMLHNVLLQVLQSQGGEESQGGGKKSAPHLSTDGWEPISAKAEALIRAKQQGKDGKKDGKAAKDQDARVKTKVAVAGADGAATALPGAESSKAAREAGGTAEEASKGQLANAKKPHVDSKGVNTPAGKSAPSEDNNTVFVRGLPITCTREELHSQMMNYGAVKAARIVTDKATGKARGTAFVEFVNEAGAKAAAAAAQLARQGQGPEIVVGGRPVQLHPAVDADHARSLASHKTVVSGKSRQQLAKEGHIEEDTAAWNDMSEVDRTRRKRAAEEKNLKLQSPNFTVSSTRLSLRNIPKSMTEKELKALVISAIKQYATKAQPVVKQVKILTETDRKNTEGVPKSKGLGFVELSQHDHALAALRQLNNNPYIWGKERRPIVEFALEKVKVLLARQQRQLREQGRAARTAQQQPDEGEAGDGKPRHSLDVPASGLPAVNAGGTPVTAKQRHKQNRREKIKAKKERMRQAGREQDSPRNARGTPNKVALQRTPNRSGQALDRNGQTPNKSNQTPNKSGLRPKLSKSPWGGIDAGGGDKGMEHTPGNERRGRRPKGRSGQGLNKADASPNGGSKPQGGKAASLPGGTASGEGPDRMAWGGRAPFAKSHSSQGGPSKRGKNEGKRQHRAVGENGVHVAGRKVQQHQGEAGAGADKQPNKRRRKDTSTDKLDSLVAQYKARLFGASPKDGNQKAAAATANNFKHWYE